MANQIEKVLWSIAFPGFGQILNGKLVKGVIFLGLEFLINVKANLNQAIVFSFIGDIDQAILITNYQWVMFYPCIYSFAIWDAFRDAGGGKAAYAYLPCVFSAYFGTLGVVYSTVVVVFGTLLGPILLGLIGLAGGAVLGGIVKTLINSRTNSKLQKITTAE
ncbi:hypothetical protein [Sporomusa termitida]|uniref:Uncharacterized protein n=1 Tax=Sporomusa termitida TaxID=2377 RepID=A0A517DWW0_9FIRM|nr:hypothetical protein [Sporomusa termitida]QDR81840.1 hypothetical protein SPTER_32570 [Sporomusa termitida]